MGRSTPVQPHTIHRPCQAEFFSGLLEASDGLLGDVFGRAVSISGDFATIGAPGDDDLGNAAGSGFVFSGVCPCPWDLSGNGSVESEDLLELLFAWGTNPGGPPDFDGNGIVNFLDLLALLANWGNCPCVEADPPKSLPQEIEDAGLVWPDDWDKLEDIMQNGTQQEKDNAVCWFEYYMLGCDAGPREACPDADPFNNCRADLNDDCVVDSADLTILLGAWVAGTADGDINGDCVTDSTDMTLLLGAWGKCPAPCGGESAGPPALGPVLALMGFAGVADFEAHVATHGETEAFVCGCVLEVLLSAQP